MVNVASWEDFSREAEKLYMDSPDRTRYVIKYRHMDQKLVLKVTDDFKCLKYTASNSSDLKKISKLNTRFLDIMSASTSLQ